MDEKQLQKSKEYGCYDAQNKNYILFMCKKGCKFYDEFQGCTKKRIIRQCAIKGLKNRD